VFGRDLPDIEDKRGQKEDSPYPASPAVGPTARFEKQK
jgi:hypothetical protein